MPKTYKKKHGIIGESSSKKSLISVVTKVMLEKCPSINKVISGPIDASFGNNFRGIRIRPHILGQMRMVYYTNAGKQTFFVFLKGDLSKTIIELEAIATEIEDLMTGKEKFIIDTK